MVRYGELSTKGKNIGDFIKMLGNNIKRALKKYEKLESSSLITFPFNSSNLEISAAVIL